LGIERQRVAPDFVGLAFVVHCQVNWQDASLRLRSAIGLMHSALSQPATWRVRAARAGSRRSARRCCTEQRPATSCIERRVVSSAAALARNSSGGRLQLYGLCPQGLWTDQPPAVPIGTTTLWLVRSLHGRKKAVKFAQQAK
jgi:hypothetical protein